MNSLSLKLILVFAVILHTKESVFRPIFFETKESIFLDIDLGSTITEHFRKRLKGGLKSYIVIRFSTLDPVSGETLYRSFQNCELQLDLWENHTIFKSLRPDKITEGSSIAMSDAINTCTKIQKLKILPEKHIKERKIVVNIEVALNPVSQDVIEKARDFMSNPRGSTPGRPRSFMGAIARLFREDSKNVGEIQKIKTPPFSIQEGKK